MRNKILKTAALILAAAMAAALPFSPVFAENRVVHILNAEDLKELAENCSYDAWSMGRTVSLDRDISLGEDAFSPIPGFEGTFLGNGHTISGLSVTGSGSPAGLFAVLGENAEVKDLNVEGTVSPAGDCRRTGGIAGKNSGTISNCTFTGTVNGRSMTGGIAGENTSRGTIISCRASGGAFGRSMTGGICGKNSGLVSSCTGSAFVNTKPSDPSFSVTEAGTDMIRGLKSLVSPDTYDIPTDCGGIAGFSDGSIESCRNEGTVGYQSIGYNTGGIAGRTSGVILNCKNSGLVSGRRNAGGIAGLAEPYISVVMTPDRLDALRSELDGLDSMIQSALDDASDTSDSVSERLSALRAAVNSAAKTADDIGKKAGSYADDVASELDSAEDVIKNSLDLLSQADEDMIKASSELGRSLRDLSRAADSLDSDVADEIRSGVSDIDRASDILDAATEEFKKADSLIRSAVSSPESTTAEDLKLIPKAIASGIGIIKNGRPEDDGGALAYAQRGIQALERGIENSDAPVPDLEDAMDEASAASSGLTASLKDLEAVLSYLQGRQAPDIKAPEIGEDTDRLYDSMTRISDQLALLDQEVGPSSEKLIEDVRKIEERFRAVTRTLLGAADDVMGASAEDIADDVSQVDPMMVTDGKTALCENEGQISCDVNGGGIAGSMSVFDPLDPESDSPVTISSALHRTYQYRCVILRCTDIGTVTVKKSCAGGICGDQSLGLITECTAASDVSCESGDLAGGIAGRSGSVIRGCWSKSSVSARRYSGGITGGSDDEDTRLLVEDCRALCEGDRSQDACGAISGGSSGSFKNNFFCSDSLGGINGLSIKGAAEPVSYEELVKGGSVPQQMRSLTLSFTADGAQVKTIRFDYGDSFGPDIFPQVPQKDGEYGRWDRDELTDLHFDTEVKAVYRPYISSIASGIERKDGRPVFIAVGSFTEDDVLAPVPAALDFDPGRESLADRIRSYSRALVEQWTVEIPESFGDGAVLRYLPPSGSGAVDLYRLTDDGWEKIQAEAFGSYLSFEAGPGRISVSAVSAEAPWWLKVAVAAFTVMLLSVAAAAFIRIKEKDRTEDARKKAAAVKKRIVCVLLILALIFAAIIAAAVMLKPEIRSLELYGLLKNMAERTGTAGELTVTIRDGGSTLGFNARVSNMTAGEKRVSCVQWHGIPFWLCDNAVILENGRIIRVGTVPDHRKLLEYAAPAFTGLDVRSETVNDTCIYRASLGGKAASDLLGAFAPAGVDLSGLSERTELFLEVTDGEPRDLRLEFAGEDKGISVKLAFGKGSWDVPLTREAEAAITSDGLKNAAPADEEDIKPAVSLMKALSLYGNTARITVSADCGPVKTDSSCSWQRIGGFAPDLSLADIGGTVLWSAGGMTCTGAGRLLEGSGTTFRDPDGLIMTAMRALLNADEGKNAGSVPLTDTAMYELARLAAPQTASMPLDLSGGRLICSMSEDGEIKEMVLRSEGVLRMGTEDIDASFYAKILFTGAGTFEAPDEEVTKALQVEETGR